MDDEIALFIAEDDLDNINVIVILVADELVEPIRSAKHKHNYFLGYLMSKTEVVVMFIYLNSN